jgi:hypothetical protein
MPDHEDLAGRVLSVASMRARVAELGEWITGFTYQGEAFGGGYLTENDPRVGPFIARLGAEGPRAILECGCLEGGHTTMLAQAFPEATIYAVDVRKENLAKARLLARVRNCANIEFSTGDFDAPGPIFRRTYDAIFCVGLLYHLRWPNVFLKHACAAAPLLWLWTVYCEEKDAAVGEADFRGRLYTEPTEHPLSGVRLESYWPTLGSLCDMLWIAGYTRIELLDSKPTANGAGPAILLCATR